MEQYRGTFKANNILRYPIIPGHEPIGRIVEIGPEAKRTWRLNQGDRVWASADETRKSYELAGGAPHAANNLLKCIRLLMRYAVELEWRDDDPTMGVRNIKTASLGFHTWSEDEIAAYEKRWEIGTRKRLAFALAFYTGQRRGDIVRMGRQHIRDDSIEVRQQKTGVTLTIPLHPALRATLEAAPKDNLTFLTNRYGKPFSPAGFTGWFRECVEEAALPLGCGVHGLRKAAARRLAEAGCIAHQIAAITGHRTLKEVQRYTSAADQKRLAQDAIAALQQPAFRRSANKARATVRKLPNRKAGLGNPGEKRR